MRAILILLILATCAEAQAGESYPAIPAGARVGYLVAVPDSPVYALSQGGSYSAKRHPVTWPLRQSMEQAIAAGLTESGLVAVDLGTLGVKAAHLHDLLKMEGRGTLQEGKLHWEIAEGRQVVVDVLRNELDLAAVIFVMEAARPMFPCINCIGSMDAAGGGLVVEKYGLFGKTIKVRAITSFRWNIYTLAVPADYARDENLSAHTEVARIKITPEPKLADVYHPTAAEFEPVREAMIERSRRIATDAAKLLLSGFPAADPTQAVDSL